MERITLGNRPASIPATTRIEDFLHDGIRVRVCMDLLRGPDDTLIIDAQAFEVDAAGAFVSGPNVRPSRTRGLQTTVQASSLGDTHTLSAGWVREVGTYTADSFAPYAPRGEGKPTAEPDWQANPSGQYFDTAAGIGYRWDEGEALRIAKARAEELCNIVRNSSALAGLGF